jgi:general secretion pathway protein A
MLRLLTNFDMDSRLVLSVVLAGQPPLRTMLGRPEQQAIAHRLAHYATLRLLSRDETHAYVAHRSAVAGAHTAPFDPDAQEAIFELSRGNLRAIDRLALKAIELTVGDGASVVSSGEVIRARQLLWP